MKRTTMARVIAEASAVCLFIGVGVAYADGETPQSGDGPQQAPVCAAVIPRPPECDDWHPPVTIEPPGFEETTTVPETTTIPDAKEEAEEACGR